MEYVQQEIMFIIYCLVKKTNGECVDDLSEIKRIYVFTCMYRKVGINRKICQQFFLCGENTNNYRW